MKFRIHAHVTFGIVRLRTIELGRLNTDQAFVPAKRAPGQHVNFVPAQARHRTKKKNLVLLEAGMLAPPLRFRQFCQVEGASVAWHAHRLDLDAAKWHWFRKLHKVTNPRNGFGAEE